MKEEKFTEIYPDYDIKSLPSCVRDDLDNVLVTGKRKKTIITSDGKKYSLDNKLNHLSGSEWVYFTNSVINTRYSTAGKDNYGYSHRKVHPTPKPPPLMKDIIEFFTKENDIVLDYFMGVGGTLIAASLSNRKAVGIDLNKNYIDAYKKANNSLGIEEQVVYHGNSLDILKSKEFILKYNQKISFILIDPPYGNMMSKEKTGSTMRKKGKEATPFTENEHDLGNMSDKDFLKTLKKSVKISTKYLKNEKYIAIFIKDMQPNKKVTNLLHADIIREINSIPNVYYKGLKIWADQNAKLFPYGYPYSFVTTQIHQYILFFQKIDELK